VGINSSTPAAVLSITGSSTLPSLYVASSSGASELVVDATGNVGVGTTTPSYKLEVSSTAVQDGISVNTTGNFPELRLQRSGVTKGQIGINGNGGGYGSTLTDALVVLSQNALQLAAAGSNPQLTIATSGNVGIGTTTPGQKLVVSGQEQITGGSPALGSLLESDANGVATWVATSTLGITSPQYLSVNGSALYNNTGYEFGINSSTPIANLSVVGSSTAPTILLFSVASSSGSQYLTVTPAGNVGIGTTTPATKLSVVGAAGNNDVLDVASSTGASLLHVSAKGYVGI